MRMHPLQGLIALGLMSLPVAAEATDLTIHLNSTQPVIRKSVQYECDVHGASMGLPSGPFTVEYLDGAGNSLVVVPVKGASLIFANVMSGSGARYAAGPYIWWDAAGAVSFSSDSPGKLKSVCHRR